jgi:hypothetical protein
VAAPIAPHVGLGGEWSRIGSLTSVVPIWFLATYLVVVALAPVTMAAWDRWGPRTLAVGLLALPVGALSLHLDSTAVGALNLLIVWGTMHQFGYAWRDGTFRRPSRAVLVGLVGFGGAVALVWFGPYSVSMVGVNGYGVNNTNPPRATLFLLGCALTGLVFLAEPTLGRLAAARACIPSRTPPGGGLRGRRGSCFSARPRPSLWQSWDAFEDPPRTKVTEARSPTLPLLQVGLTGVLLGLLADDGLGDSARVAELWLIVLAALAALAGLDHLLAWDDRPSPHEGRSLEAAAPWHREDEPADGPIPSREGSD